MGNTTLELYVCNLKANPICARAILFSLVDIESERDLPGKNQIFVLGHIAKGHYDKK